MTTNHNGENWPYHPYEGANPKLQGSYVPCATNPCTLHGGSEIYATSSEDAYAKAHQNDTWGFTTDKTVLANENIIVNNDVSMINQSSETDTELDSDSMTNTSKSSISNNTTTITDSKTTVNTMQTHANSKTVHDNNKTVKLANTSSNQSGYATNKAKDIAIKQGLYIDGSPLLHRLTDDEKRKYLKIGASQYGLYSESIDMQAFARDIFPGAVLANDDIAGIKTRSMNAFNNATDSEREAIKAYTDENYRYINKLLRNGSLGDEYSPEFVNRINSYIKNINAFMHNHTVSKVIDKDTVVFRKRYLSESDQLRGYEEQAYYKAVAKSMRDGSEPIITRPDYMSTTWDIPEHFKNLRCSYLIKIPAGTRGIDISDKNVYNEHEFLIDKGYKFKVVGIYELSKLRDTMNYPDEPETKWSQDGYPIIALELIPSKN